MEPDGDERRLSRIWKRALETIVTTTKNMEEWASQLGSSTAKGY
jgi:hypothetical protein